MRCVARLVVVLCGSFVVGCNGGLGQATNQSDSGSNQTDAGVHQPGFSAPDLGEGQCSAAECEECASYTLGSEMLVDTTLEEHGAPAVVVPEPPYFERVLRQAEFTKVDCPDSSNPSCPDAVHVRGTAKLLHPAIPALRTSVDGHLALFGGPKVGALRLEAFDNKPLIEQPATLLNDIVGGTRDIDFGGVTVPGGLPKRTAAPDRTFCSANAQAYACGSDDKDDCYDLLMIEDWQGFSSAECPSGYGEKCARLASIPLRVRIRDPQTTTA